jgi:hypothetical protein
MARCQGKTKSGTRCKNNTIEDTHYCRTHQPETESASASSERKQNSGNDQWRADQTTVAAIGGATFGAMVMGPLGAVVGGTLGAIASNYDGWDNIIPDFSNNNDDDDE